MKKKGDCIFWGLLFLVLFTLTGLRHAVGSGSFRNEEVKIVTDRQVYVAGETVFFRIFHFFEGNIFEENAFMYLLLRNQAAENILELTYRFEEGDSFGDFYLPDTLSTGAYQLFAFTDTMKRMPGLRFEPANLLVINRFDETLDGLTFLPSIDRNGENNYFKTFSDHSVQLISEINKENFSRREPVTLNIKSNSELLDLSVSVVRQETFFDGFSFALATGTEPDSRSLQWPYFRENDEYLLTGRLIDQQSGDAITGYRVMLSRPDTIINLLVAETDLKGRFVFSLSDYFFDNELFLQVFEEDQLRMPKIILDSKWKVDETHFFTMPDFEASQREFFNLMQTTVGVTKSFNVAFGPEPTSFLAARTGKEPRIYSRPSHVFRLDEYEPLGGLQEIAREIIPYLRIRNQGNEFTARIMDESSSFSFFNRGPMVFLDGIPVRNINNLVDLNSSDLRKIEVVSFPWRYGPPEFDGIQALFSQRSESLLYERSNPLKKVRFPQVKSATRYIKPDYDLAENKLDRVPDFRHTLFWEPRLLLEKWENIQLGFFTGDLPGTYCVLITSVTKDGKNIMQLKTFQVELK